jgi:hypothetical protein
MKIIALISENKKIKPENLLEEWKNKNRDVYAYFNATEIKTPSKRWFENCGHALFHHAGWRDYHKTLPYWTQQYDE